MAKLYTRREAKNRRMKFAALAGVADGIGTLVGIAIIFACVILVTALATWVISDAQVSFARIFDTISRAIILPESTPMP